MLNTATINYTDFIFIIKSIVGSSIPAQSIAFTLNLCSTITTAKTSSIDIFLQLQTNIVNFRTNCCAPFFVKFVRIGRSNTDTVQLREKCIRRYFAATFKLGYHSKARESTDAKPFFIINLSYIVASYCPTGMNFIITIFRMSRNSFTSKRISRLFNISFIAAVRAQIGGAALHYFTLYFGDRSRVISYVGSIVLSKHARTAHSNAFSRPFVNSKAFSACYLGCQQCCS